MPYILVAAGACSLATLFFVSSLKMQPAAYQMPRILVALLFGLAAAMLVEVAVKKRRPAPETMEEQAAAPLRVPFFEKVNILRVAVFLGATILYVVLLEPLGYFVVTPLFLFGTLVYLKSCRLPTAIAIAALAPIFVYFVFIMLLDLPVPMGVMG